MITANLIAPDRRGWWQRFLDWLFPAFHVPAPRLCPEVQDVVGVRCCFDVSFWGRVRVLLGGRVVVLVYVACEKEPGKTGAIAGMWVEAPGRAVGAETPSSNTQTPKGEVARG